MNFDGSYKLSPLLVYKSKKPRCFNNFKVEKYCYFYNNKNSWLNSLIFTDWIKKFDSKMNSNVILLVDNFSGHKL